MSAAATLPNNIDTSAAVTTGKSTFISAYQRHAATASRFSLVIQYEGNLSQTGGQLGHGTEFLNELRELSSAQSRCITGRLSRGIWR